MRLSRSDRAVKAVEHHPAVRRVVLVGSRAAGTATALSDWDFVVETDDFQTVAHDIGALIAPLGPLAQQWDRLSENYCWMVMMPGPIKLDFIFGEPHEREPAWDPQPSNLDAIDCHFWDWVLWLHSKRSSGKADVVQGELDRMFGHILLPMGAQPPRPDSLDNAVASYLVLRAVLERRFGVSVTRTLEGQVVRALHPHR
jgi:predicted nucleotidyltransferase